MVAISDRSRWTDFKAHPVDFELGGSTEVEFSDLLRDFSVEVDVKTSTDAEVASEQRCGSLDDPAVVDKINKGAQRVGHRQIAAGVVRHSRDSTPRAP